jgi:hypothetical protein
MRTSFCRMRPLLIGFVGVGVVSCASQPTNAPGKTASTEVGKAEFSALLERQPTAAGTVQPTQYTFTALNIPTSALATHVNENGTVVGAQFEESGWYYGCTTAYKTKPFVLKNNTLTTLGTSNQSVCMYAANIQIDVNNNDLVAGTLNGHAFKWQNGTFTDLHTTIQNALGGINGSGIRAVSNTGLMAGYVYDTNSNIDAVYYNGSQWVKLLDGSMPDLYPSAVAINDSGFGILDRAAYRGANAYSTFQGTQIYPPVGFPPEIPTYHNTALAVNNMNRYVGTYDAPFGAYVHDGTTATSLGKFMDTSDVTPSAINDGGVIVGTVGAFANLTNAVVYENGAWVDLNTRTTGIPSGWTLVAANDINNKGVIVGTAVASNQYRAFMITPVPNLTTLYARGTFNSWGSTALTKQADGSFEATVNVPADTNPRFKFDIKGDWSENYGDNNGDNVADLAATKDIPFSGGAGSYKITFNYATKYYTVTKQTSNPGEDWQRTVIFIYGITQPGQDMYIRGGIDHNYAQNSLGKACTAANKLCAVPIQHRLFTTDSKRANDKYLDWYGAETGQGTVEGSPLTWTTNVWPTSWGAEKTVAQHGYGTEPLNQWGQHYWMLDVLMDCSKSVGGWFELKSFISNGPGWEGNVTQSGSPYPSINHFGKCGQLNKFERGSNAALIQPLP